jgi:hypothetical protein
MDQITTIFHHPIFAVSDRSSDLSHPEAIWTFRDSAELNASSRKLDEEKNHETLKTGFGPDFDGKEVCGHDLIPMLVEEFFPSGFPFPIRRGFDAVTSQDVGYCRCGNFVAEVLHRTLDSVVAPSTVLLSHATIKAST